jgi:hypothetical protein
LQLKFSQQSARYLFSNGVTIHFMDTFLSKGRGRSYK